MLDPKKITAVEVMNDDLVTLREDTPIKEAIVTLEEYHISGAPVVNDGGECVGVFSSTDVLKRRAEFEEGETPRAGEYFGGEPLDDDTEDTGEYFSKDEYDEAVLGRDSVGQWMTTEVRYVAPETSIDKVCQQMLAEGIHRVLVMDEKRKLRGIISSFDIVRLVAGLERKWQPKSRKEKP